MELRKKIKNHKNHNCLEHLAEAPYEFRIIFNTFSVTEVGSHYAHCPQTGNPNCLYLELQICATTPAHSVPYQVFVVYKAAYQVYKVGHYKTHFFGVDE